jgi:cation:H+ antiporter
MTTLDDDLHKDVHPQRQRLGILAAALMTLPGVAIGVSRAELAHPVEALLFGLSIVGAAFLLSWAAEAAQVDISAGLATAVLALIAVLPEYAVDFVLTFEGGQSFAADQSCPSALGPGRASPCDLALANMTGANRLLIGVGWPMVVFIVWYRLRRQGSLRRKRKWPGVVLDRTRSVELSYLTIATLYSLTLPLKSSLTLVDSVILVGIFVAYTVRLSKAPTEEPHLVGPARYIGSFHQAQRRASVIALMAFAAAVILVAAEPFAEALKETGHQLHINEFLLLQWLAPLASETPELLVAGLFAWRLNSDAALGTLVSSKVNQWTLLVGTLPIVFAIASGSTHGLPISAVQREEVFLTAAQSFFAIAILASLTMSLREAGFLFSLFWAQFILGAVVPESMRGIERIGVGIVYLALGLWVLFGDRRRVPALLRDGFRSSYSGLVARNEPPGPNEVPG